MNVGGDVGGTGDGVPSDGCENDERYRENANNQLHKWVSFENPLEVGYASAHPRNRLPRSTASSDFHVISKYPTAPLLMAGYP
jgi:hypothetical protein